MGFFSDLADLGKDIGKEFSNLGKELKTIGKETIEEIKNDPGKYALDSVKDIAITTGKLAKFTVTEVLPSMAENLAKDTVSKTEKQLQRNDLTSEEREKLEELKKNSQERAEKFEEYNIQRTISKAENELERDDITEEEKLKQERIINNSTYSMQTLEENKQRRAANE